jgi:hypothetical protein
MSTSPRFMLKTDARSDASGPYSASELRDLVRVGMLTSASLVAQEGTTRWVPAIKVKGLLTAATTDTAPPAVASAQPSRAQTASRAVGQPSSTRAASAPAHAPPPPSPPAPDRPVTRTSPPKAGGFVGRFARLPLLGSLAIAQSAPWFVGACVLTILLGFCLGLLVGFLPPRLL